MNQSSNQDVRLADAFCDAILTELSDAIDKIRHCLDQLSGDQVWWRPDEAMNSIGNLILHVCGNVQQWIFSGLGGSPDTRNRPWEFASRDAIAKADLVAMLDEIAVETRRVLQGSSANEYLRTRQIQGYDVSGMLAVIHSVAHFRGHVQEIVHMTRVQLGNKYQFDFVPGPNQHGGGA